MKQRKGINSIDKYLKRIDHNPILDFEGDKTVNYIIVVPSCGETLVDLLRLRKSLEEQTITEDFELFLILNNDVKDEKFGVQNQLVIEDFEQLKSDRFKIHLINKINLPSSKKNGVGHARKIGMDEACARFISKATDGIIICLDADCTVSPNYLQSIRNYFLAHLDMDATSIGFQHQLDGLSASNRLAIASYELHLRYFIHAQKNIGLPFALQTVGSSMAVRASAYAKEGGMPTLKAGEDFYFLHKFIVNNTCGNISEVLVYPSGRISDRVPFGTGRAVGEILGNQKKEFTSYQWQSFVEIRIFLLEVHRCIIGNSTFDLNQMNKAIADFLTSHDFIKVLNSCKENSTSLNSFYKRFFQWFNAFRLMKLLHYLRDKTFPDEELLAAVNSYLIYQQMPALDSIEKALNYFRKLDEEASARPALFQESL